MLDEADRMLDLGFIHDIKRIIALLPPKRQTLMFSATFSDDIRQLAKRLVKDPIDTVTPPNSTVERIEQVLYPVNQSDKTKLLVHLIKTQHFHHVLVFTRTKHGANRLTTTLNKKILRLRSMVTNPKTCALERSMILKIMTFKYS